MRWSFPADVICLLYLLQSSLVVPKMFCRASVHERDYDFFAICLLHILYFVQRHTTKAFLELLNLSDMITLHSLDGSMV